MNKRRTKCVIGSKFLGFITAIMLFQSCEIRTVEHGICPYYRHDLDTCIVDGSPFTGRWIQRELGGNGVVSEVDFVDGLRQGWDRYSYRPPIPTQWVYYWKGKEKGFILEWWETGEPRSVYWRPEDSAARSIHYGDLPCKFCNDTLDTEGSLDMK